METIEETKEAIEETKKTIEETTETIKGTMEAIQETTEAIQGTTEAIQETMEAIQETMEAIQETMEAIQETTETIEETTDDDVSNKNFEDLLSKLSKEDLDRHQYLFNCLKTMCQQLPSKTYKLITDSLLSELALSLIDQTVVNILIMLRIQQKNKEQELMAFRDQQMTKLDTKRTHKMAQIDKQYSAGEITSEKREQLLKEMKKHYEEKVISIDLQILHQLDKLVKEQQRTLKDAQIPGFYETHKAREIEIQVKLLNFITQIDDLCNEDRLLMNLG